MFMKMKRVTSLIMASAMALSLAAAPVAHAVDLAPTSENYQWESQSVDGETNTGNETVAGEEAGTEAGEGQNDDQQAQVEGENTDETPVPDEQDVQQGETDLDAQESEGQSDEIAPNPDPIKRMENCIISLDRTSFVYDGTAKYPRVTVTNNLGQVLAQDTDYTLRYSNNVGAGVGTVEVFGLTYSGSRTINFTIEMGENSIQAEDISRPATSSVAQSFYLNARAAAGTLSFYSDEEAVSVDRTGRVTVEPNFVGTAHITITASSQNMGDAVKTIDVTIYRMKDEIFAKGIALEASEAAIVAPVRVNHRSTGALSFTFSDGNVSSDGKGNVNIAAEFSGVVHATVKSADAGAYEGAETTFDINVYPKPTSIESLKTASDKGDKMKVAWKKNATAGGYRIQYSTDEGFEKDVETINIQGNQTTAKTISGLQAGKTYYVQIQALSKGTTELTARWSEAESLKVVAAPATTKLSKAYNKKGKKIRTTWKKTKGASGYQIQYSTEKTFKSAKSVKVKSAKTTSKTIKNLTKGKTYYVRIRTVKTVGGNNFYSKWSGYRTVKVKK